MKKLLLLLMIVPMIGFGQNKYKWKETKLKKGVLLLKSTKEPVTGIVEGGERIWFGEIIPLPFFSSFQHNVVYENGKKISCIGYMRNGSIYHKHDENHFTTLYYPNGQIYMQGIEDYEGNRNGVTKYYYGNGQLKSEMTYKDSKLDGIFKSYYKNGQLSEEGNVKSKDHVKHALQDGVWSKYYENGQLKTQGKYKDGKKQGLWKKWHRHGEIKNEKDH